MQEFTQYTEKDLAKTIKNAKLLSSFDMRRLEEEHEYETDMEHIMNGKRVLDIDFYHAVEFFVIENPLLFVDNVENKI